MRAAGNQSRRVWRQAALARIALSAAFAVILLFAHGAEAQAIKRLILNDGSYQTTTEWKIDGERVNYFSAERGQWEQLPASLVDWKATDRWNADTVKAREEELQQVSGDEVAQRKLEMLNTPQVAPQVDPALRLPSSGGVYLLQQDEGTLELRQVHGRDPDQNRHTTQNLLRQTVIPFAKRIDTLELKGRSSPVRAKPGAAIFVDVEDADGPIAGSRFRIVRLEPKDDARVVAKQSIALSGQVKMEAAYVPAEARMFSGDWWRMEPARALEPGEYAVVIPEDEQVGLVWDFGIDK
jgi:hypothetical protein